MIRKLKKASIVLWVICGISFVLALWGSSKVLYNDPRGFALIYVIPDLIVKPWHQILTPDEKIALTISYLFMAIPVIFASIAIVLRLIAKALDEQSIRTIILLNEDKKKSKEE